MNDRPMHLRMHNLWATETKLTCIYNLILNNYQPIPDDIHIDKKKLLISWFLRILVASWHSIEIDLPSNLLF